MLTKPAVENLGYQKQSKLKQIKQNNERRRKKRNVNKHCLEATSMYEYIVLICGACFSRIHTRQDVCQRGISNKKWKLTIVIGKSKVECSKFLRSQSLRVAQKKHHKMLRHKKKAIDGLLVFTPTRTTNSKKMKKVEQNNWKWKVQSMNVPRFR